MKAQIKRWLAPPVFEGDEEKTWRASFLNTTAIVLAIFIAAVFIGNLIGGRIPTTTLVIDIIMFTGVLILRRLLFNGKVTLAGIAVIVFGTIFVTAITVSLGTVRTPATAAFMLVVIISGFLFGKKGLVLTTVSSSLAVLGLILAENSGMLPRPDYIVNITQWVTYTFFFGLTGALTYHSHQSTFQALKRVSKESVELKCAEEALKESEEKLNTLLNATTEVACLFKRDGTFLAANDATAKNMGRKKEELIGKNIRDFFPAEVAERRMDRVQKILESKKPIQWEGEYAENFFSNSVYPVLDDNGDVKQIALFAKNITERKHVEEALENSEERYRNLVENINDMIFKIDMEGNFTYISPAIKRISKYYNMEELIGQSFTNFVHPEDLPELQNFFEQDVADMEESREFRVLDKDGEVHHVHISSRLQLEEGVPVGITGVMTDITEKKKAEVAQKNSEERYRNLVENVNDVIFNLDMEGNFTYISPVIEKLFGYKMEEVVNRPFMEYIHPDDLNGLLKSLEQTITGVLKPYEFRVFKKDGEIRHVRTSSRLQLEGGVPVGINGVMADITERKKAEEALAGAAKEWKETFDAVDDMIAIIDYDRNILRANKAMKKAFGDREIKEKKCYELFHGTDEPISLCPCTRSFETGELEHLELMEPYLDNRVFDVFTYPIGSEEGGTKKVVHMARDITDRKRAEDKLKLYAENIERANKDVRNFSYIVSHDLKTPLINIKGYNDKVNSAFEEISQLINPLLSQLDESGRERFSNLVEEDVPKYMDFINLSTNRIGAISNAILKLSRIGRGELTLSSIKMDKLVKSSLQNLAHKIEGKGTKINVKELYEVVADWNSMQIIIDNLISNAVNYLDPERVGEIEIRAVEGTDETTFYIKDNGIGIAENDKERIFNIFQRSGKQDVPGEGMGLAYVKTLVERHDGRIWCESELGVGSTFIFTISKHLGKREVEKSRESMKDNLKV